MLKNCDNQLKFRQFRNKFFATKNHKILELLSHTDQIKNKPQDLLVILAVATRRIARNFSRGKQQPSFKI